MAVWRERAKDTEGGVERRKRDRMVRRSESRRI
jgi:hypothetical protein